MKNIISIILLCFIWHINQAQEIEAPYFLLKDAEKQHMVLEASNAEVFIAGIIADVRLTQEYRNTGIDPIEAIYVFPGSAQSAVYDMEMQIGNRVIKAELQEKEKARKTYEKAKKEGKRTSLLEQHRPNVFQMNVANIMPGEKIIVRLKFTEQLIPKFNQYSFHLPTVVGPRYHEPSETNPAHFVNMPYTHEKESPKYEFSIQVYLNAGQTIQKINSHTHKIDIHKLSANSSFIEIDPTELYAGNKDFVLNYQLAGNEISSGMLFYEHEDENFFLANIQAPQMLADDLIPPREYIFIIDVSGSMFGFPLDLSKKMIKELILGLRPSDRFNMLLFAGTSYTLSDTSLLASEENIDYALNGLDAFTGGGSTRLLPALQKALDLPLMNQDVSRSMVILTDGYISVEKEAFELLRNNLNRSNVFAFGIGSSTNRFLIEGLAHVGQGEAFIVENETIACDVAESFKRYISRPSLTDIEIDFDGFETFDVLPSSLPDLFSENPINIIGKYKGPLEGQIILKAKLGSMPFTKVIELDEKLESDENVALRSLWARKKIQYLDDYRKIFYDNSHKEEMTALSLKYNLLSAYTSFVAVDYERAHNGELSLKPIKQALPMPVGVSDHAIGAEMELKKSKVYKKPKSQLKFVQLNAELLENMEYEIKKMAILKIHKLKSHLREEYTGQFEIVLHFENGSLHKIKIHGISSEKVRNLLLTEVKSWDFSLLELGNESFSLHYMNQ